MDSNSKTITLNKSGRGDITGNLILNTYIIYTHKRLFGSKLNTNSKKKKELMDYFPSAHVSGCPESKKKYLKK